jgi:phosphate-selective porin OprO/OprP
VPNKPFGSGGWGAWEVAVRYSEFDASDFTASTNFTNKADAFTVGLKWIPVTNVRFYLNYVDTQFDTPITVNGEQYDDEQAVTLRAAIYF